MNQTPQIFNLYKGKCKVEFYENPRHEYFLNGEKKIGATTYIAIIDKSAPLIHWATNLAGDYLSNLLEAGKPVKVEDVTKSVNLHREKKEKAADVGTVAMDWIEYYIKDKLGKEKKKPLPEDTGALIAIDAFLDWEKEYKIKFISTERVVYSLKHDYMGKLDIEARVNGKLCMIDIKTGNALYAEVALQTAAYLKADEEESGKIYDGRWAVRLAKETEKEYKARMEKKGKKTDGYVPFEAKYLDDDPKALDRDFVAFRACMVIKKWQKVAEPNFRK